jgi:ABC-type glycerol-3-phosphate transport system permease component
MAELAVPAQTGSRPSVRSTSLRRLLRTLSSHLLIIAVGLFFFVPFLWMLSTALKSDQDVFRSPPTLLPHDNKFVTINGEEVPVYSVQVEGEGSTPQALALLEIAEGMGTFVDPARPEEPIEVRMKFAQPVLQVGFRWQNFADAINTANRPGLGVTFWTYVQNSVLIAIFSILGTLISCAPAAYGFGRLKWPGRDLIFYVVLAGQHLLTLGRANLLWQRL